jgi:hypothetical protein
MDNLTINKEDKLLKGKSLQRSSERNRNMEYSLEERNMNSQINVLGKTHSAINKLNDSAMQDNDIFERQTLESQMLTQIANHFCHSKKGIL